MKKIVSLMVSFMMLINPVAGVLAEGEAVQTPETETVTVTAPDDSGNPEVEKTVEAIDVTGTDDQTGAEVIAEASESSADLTVNNEIQVTSEDGPATGAIVSTGETENSSAGLTAGNVSVDGQYSTGIVAEHDPDSTENTIDVNVEKVTAASENSASGVVADASGNKDLTNVTTKEIAVDGNEMATGINAISDSYDASDSNNQVTVNAENVSATSANGMAKGISADTTGSQNEVDVTAKEVTTDGAVSIAVDASTTNDSEFAGGNTTAVTTANITSTSADGSATGVNASASGKQNETSVKSGDVTAEGKESTAVYASTLNGGDPTGNNKTTVTAENITSTSTSDDGSAHGVLTYTSGNQNETTVTSENVTVEGNSASAVRATTGAAGDSEGGNKTAVTAADISSTSTDGFATGIDTYTGGHQDETTVKAGNVITEGTQGASGVRVMDSFNGKAAVESETSVTTANITSTSTEGYADGVEAGFIGEKNTIQVTAEDISAKGKTGTTGIKVDSESGSDNTAIVNAQNVTATSTDERASGVDISTGGSRNETVVSADTVTAEGIMNTYGVKSATLFGEDSEGGNKTTVKTDNIDAISADWNAYGVDVGVVGDKNSTEVTTGDISARGNNGATGVAVRVDSATDYDTDETIGSDNKVIADVGNVTSIVVSETQQGKALGNLDATGIDGHVSDEGNTAEITAKNVTVEVTATSENNRDVIAFGVSADSSEGGKQKLTTGDVEVKATSESEFDPEQSSFDTVNSIARGVSVDAYDKGSEVTITTGSVTAEAAADGGIVIDDNRIRYQPTAEGTAVDLVVGDAGNISYTADGDVRLTLTNNLKERPADDTPSSTHISETTEYERGTYTGVSNAGIMISVVGSDSEVAAVIKGNVEANSTANRPDTGETIDVYNVAGVVIGDNNIGEYLSNSKKYDENGNLIEEKKEDGSYAKYSDGKKTFEHDEQTGISVRYHENGTKEMEYDEFGNTVYYDENGNETSRTGDLKEKTPEVSGTANVKIEGDITSNGVGLEVVPTHSGGNVNVIVEGTIKGESGAVVVNDNVNAGNFNLTVWKIDPTTYYEFDENGEIISEEENYLQVNTPEDNGYKNDTAAAEELLKQVQYIIKVDPNISNAHVDLDGTSKFTDFTGEEYDVAHEDDRVVVKISADSGYRITGAFNGEGKEETLLRDSDGNYYIVVPRGGGVYLTATVEEIREESQEETEERTAPTRVKTDEQKNEDGALTASETVEANTSNNNAAVLAALETVEANTPNNRVAIPAVNSLLKGEERKTLATLAPTQQLLVILEKAGFSDAAAASGLTVGEETKKLLNSLDVDLRKAVKMVYSYENGVKVKWYYVEMNLPGNKIARYGFRQLEDGSWVVKLL